MPASQEFRDGAAYGALELARRLNVVASFGFLLDVHNIENAAKEIKTMMGGHVSYPLEPVEIVGETPRRCECLIDKTHGHGGPVDWHGCHRCTNVWPRNAEVPICLNQEPQDSRPE